MVSPHLDDAVFSCGAVLSDNLWPTPIVMTVCAGIPPDGMLSYFDEQAGFTSSADTVNARRAEDGAAADVLGYLPMWLDELDAQYMPDRVSSSTISDSVARTLGELSPDRVIGPVGQHHPDHEAVALAVRAYCTAAGCELTVYDELPYAPLWPDEHALALGSWQLTGGGWTEPCTPKKREAIACYASQLEGMTVEALYGPERFHEVTL